MRDLISELLNVEDDIEEMYSKMSPINPKKNERTKIYFETFRQNKERLDILIKKRHDITFLCNMKYNIDF